ncbi:MAG TPA: succinate dehydrogenase, cytochrome b556 subunit, partial [Armatimonadota bacterium]|nr:succinate dehydrogenase, cytochrome b556 subunit [Armatimonadota bacterium]
REGMWSWVLHRVAGVGIFIFLVAHIVDTSFVGWSADLYNHTVALYRSSIGRIGEIILIGAVLLHAFNGLRIITIDFVPKATRIQRQLFYVVVIVFLAVFIPGAYYLARAMF